MLEQVFSRFREREPNKLFSDQERKKLIDEVEEIISALPKEYLGVRGTAGSSLWSENDVALLVSTMEHFASVVAPHLHKYDTFIGDDSSGRLPALFTWRLAKQLAGNGQQTPSLRFIAPTAEMRFSHSEELEHKDTYMDAVQHIEKMGSKKRILFVTEYIYSGLSIRSLVQAARKAGLEADIAAVSVEQVDVQLPDYVHLYKAGDGREGRTLFEFAKVKSKYIRNHGAEPYAVDRDQLTGVVKKQSTELLPHDGGKIFSKVRENQQQKLVAAARDIMNVLADACSEKLKNRS
jgi:hypothetical protein